MDYSTTFARHFARLVHLLLHDAGNIANQKAALRLLVTMSKEGTVSLTIRDWQLAVNGNAVAAQLEGVEDLTAQLIGHSVAELATDRGAAPADLLGIARILATEAVPGDGGNLVQSRLEALGARTVRVKLAETGSRIRLSGPYPVIAPQDNTRVAAPAPPSARRPSGERSVEQPPSLPVESATVSESRDGVTSPATAASNDSRHARHESEGASPEATSPKVGATRRDSGSFLGDFAIEAAGGSLPDVLKDLDASRTVNDATGQLDRLVGMAESAFREVQPEVVAEIFAAIVKREGETTDSGIRRAFSTAIRRLTKQPILTTVASLIPKRRGRYDEYMAIITRAGEDGAEAVVEQLNSAQSLLDRRVFLDSLVKLNAGVSVLIHMLGDSRWYVVRNAADLLGEMQAASAEAKLTEVLQHQDDRVRRSAVSALAKLGTTAAITGLAASMHDASAGVRVRTAAALARSKSPAAAAALIAQLDSEEDSEVQLAILAALGRVASSDAVRCLIKAAQPEGRLFKKKSVAFRVQAVRALGEARTPAAMGALQTFVNDREKDVREAVFWAVQGHDRGANAR